MARDDKYACRNCAHYDGNCGHHFRNSLGHIEYDCPSESEYDGRFACDGPACFEPNEEQIRLERETKITELTQYPMDILEEALSRLRGRESEFHCGIEESGGHAYNCNDCPNKCEEWHQWDKEMKGDEDGSDEM